MAITRKQTSPSVASSAGKALGSSSSSALQKSLTGPALRQSGTRVQTGASTEAKAGKALDNPHSASLTRTLAGSVASQSNKKR